MYGEYYESSDPRDERIKHDSLENNLHCNLIKDVEQLHSDLFIDRHRKICMKAVYETCIDDIAKRNNLFREYVHDYYIHRYKYDWRTNTNLNDKVPSFLQNQA